MDPAEGTDEDERRINSDVPSAKKHQLLVKNAVRKLKRLRPAVTYEQVEQVLREIGIHQQFTPLQPPKIVYDTIHCRPHDCAQCDLLDVHYYARQNAGVHFVVVYIEVYSRLALFLPLRSKKEDDVLICLKICFETLGFPKTLTSDKESAISGALIQQYLQQHDVKHFAYGEDQKTKLGMVERLNRTWWERTERIFRANKTRTWLYFNPAVNASYNETVHSARCEAPLDVFEGNKPSRQAIINVNHGL